jgi:hypothetical protein
MTDAKLKPPSAQVVEDCELDIIVTRLYRRFKDWSRRGFGPDDVTWCEVKADVTAAILPLFAAREAAVLENATRIARDAYDDSSKADSPFDGGAGSCGWQAACNEIERRISAMITAAAPRTEPCAEARRERDEAVEALKPFGAVAETFCEGGDPDEVIRTDGEDDLRVKHFRRAAAIISRHAKTGGEHD